MPISHQVEARRETAALTRALRPYLSHPTNYPTRVALDVARNVAAVLVLEPELRADHVIEAALVLRMRRLALRVSDVETATVDGARAWMRATVAA